MARLAAVVVLAAGEGTRMRSGTPKVLHEVGGRSLLGHVLHATAPLGATRTLVVVGHSRDRVTEMLAATAPDATPVVQAEQHGTGHAVRLALEAAPDADGTVLVLCGDTPLLRTETLQALLDAHVGGTTMLTAVMADPTGYGRILRDESGRVTGIVEQKDADEAQRAIAEANAGVYAFDAAALRDALTRISTDNVQHEEYLTDVVGLMVADRLPVTAYQVADPLDVIGVNDRVQLAQAGAALRDRAVAALQRSGVTITDPATTWIDDTVECEPDSVIEPFTILKGATVVRRAAVVGPYSTLTDTTIGEGASVVSATCVGAVIGPEASVGPYTYLRPGTRLGRGAKAGGFVEMKNADVGAESKVPHLSYVGDATIGERSNIGAATVFVNYDGREKHHTTVGDDVRVGSDTMLVAPVTIGDTAYTAAGSVITADVPPGALGVGRAKQRNIEGWVERRRGAAADVEQDERGESQQ
ncbi:MAG TPA: bifunctional UDP-N-acetylglucosamine diphosphorylase/glucosamine-1-phosphate N-acetyltransferase GlmU [Mycobacteriales bacterium]|nr:bifunctional UDP-N-acetylglucosamine diphosphorylase/glucosamine-1-phosphate N-acetyltransferase GlmU [Mycobacteriales bacterium]